MGHARHIGRVGALAVALGVGVAVASSPGIAYADPSEGGSADSSSSSDASSSSSPGGSAGADASAPNRTRSSHGSDGATKDGSTKDGSTNDGSTKGDDKPTEKPDTKDASDDAESDAHDTEEESTSGVTEAEIPPTEAETPPTEAEAPLVEAETPPVEAETPQAEAAPVQDHHDGSGPDSAQPTVRAHPTAAVATVAVADTDSEAHAAVPAADVDLDPQAWSVAAAERTPATGSATAVSAAVPAPPTVPQPPRTLISVVTEFVASVLHPLLSAAEGSPIQIPILSAVLSLVRNEFERILAPQTVNVASQQTVALITDPTPLADPTRPRVLVIGVDGTNLSRILADDYNQNFFTLLGNSTSAASSIVGHTTISNPSWSAILTGVWGERTGVINNVFTPWTYNTWPTVFNQLEAIDRDIQTMAIGNWDVINAIAGAGSIPADENVFVGRVEGDTNWLDTDDRVAALTIDAIRGTTGPTPNFLFSYYVGIDENGHSYGGASTEYRDAIRNMDDNLGDILAEVAIREAMGEDWTVIVVTDHGHQPQVGFGHGFQSPDETETFVIAEGTDFGDGLINQKYQIVDITPTVVKLFGGTPRAGSDGVPLMTLDGSSVDPADLQQALKDAIASNDYPDIVTNAVLGVRTIFATVPYYVFTFGNDIGAMVPGVLAGPVKFVFDGLYVITNVPAQIVAFLTGVSGASIFPLLPPAPPMFPPAEETILPDSVVVLSCGAPGSVAESYCGAANVA